MSCKSNLNFYYMDMSPPSRAVWMVLEELGIDYNPHYINIFKGEQKTEEYRKISFRQKVPAIKEGDFCLAESRAVAAYLASEYGAKQGKGYLYPQDAKQRSKVDQHLYIGENITDAFVNYANPGGVFFRGEEPRYEKQSDVKVNLLMIEKLLNENTYTVADNLTIADFFYYIATTLLWLTDFDDYREFPKLLQWQKRMAALPYHTKTCEEPMKKFKERYQAQLKQNKEKNQKEE